MATKATPRERVLLDALRAIKSDESACTCHERSWYGDEHDGECPIGVAEYAISRFRAMPATPRPVKHGGRANG